MTERSADTTSPRRPLPPPPAGPPPSGPPPKTPPPKLPPKAEAKDGPKDGPVVEETAAKPTLAERIQAKLTPSTEERPAAADPNGTAPPAKKPAKQTAPKPAPQSRGPRRARLRLTRVDPWSVMKSAFLLSIAFGVVTVVAVAMVWTVLDGAGVWTSINETVRETIGGNDIADFDIENYLGTSRVLGFTMLVAAVDVVLLTAIATLGAFLYNMSAALLGGIEVTLAEDNH